VSYAALTIVYFLVLTPIGVAMRLFVGDPLQRAPVLGATTYWRDRGPSRAQGAIRAGLTMPDEESNAFAGQAAEKPRSAASQFIAFALGNKKWWLTPIIIVLALIALLVVLGGTGMAPFIYSLF
jgi:hypothetical protein